MGGFREQSSFHQSSLDSSWLFPEALSPWYFFFQTERNLAFIVVPLPPIPALAFALLVEKPRLKNREANFLKKKIILLKLFFFFHLSFSFEPVPIALLLPPESQNKTSLSLCDVRTNSNLVLVLNSVIRKE